MKLNRRIRALLNIRHQRAQLLLPPKEGEKGLGYDLRAKLIRGLLQDQSDSEG